MTSPMLWYLNRGTGLVLLCLFTATVFVGILSTGRGGRIWPRFVTQGLHRQLSLVTTALLTAHVISAVVDEYVDIRWWQALVPVGGTYRPLYLGLGALALDFTVAVGLSSVLRSRLSESAWKAVHLTTYVAWLAALAHTVGIGTDSYQTWGLAVVAACVAVVTLGLAVRIFVLRRGVRLT
jgi:methionine sulfoxide reductase heme-binding subunit